MKMGLLIGIIMTLSETFNPIDKPWSQLQPQKVIRGQSLNLRLVNLNKNIK